MAAFIPPLPTILQLLINHPHLMHGSLLHWSICASSLTLFLHAGADVDEVDSLMAQLRELGLNVQAEEEDEESGEGMAGVLASFMYLTALHMNHMI